MASTDQQQHTMHTALISHWGHPPTYTTAPTPSIPPATSPLALIRVHATGLHQVVRSRASGTHYTSTSLPHTPGADGTGTLYLPSDTLDAPTGPRVYFITLGGARGSAPGASPGSFADLVTVSRAAIFELPPDGGVDATQVAAFANPVMSSWMALRARVAPFPANGWSCVVLGATSASGGFAVEVARMLGAGRVVGVGRSEEGLRRVRGLDGWVVLRGEDTDWGAVAQGDVDVVLDYLYGEPARMMLKALRSSVPTQYVQIGGLAAGEGESKGVMGLEGAVLRGKDVTMRGAGPGSWRMQDLAREMPAMLEAFRTLRPREIREERLEDVERVWADEKTGERIVFVP